MAATAAFAGYLGFCLGVRRERGRLAFIAEIERERRVAGGIKLKSIRVRR
jgi:hypothetical protein